MGQFPLFFTQKEKEGPLEWGAEGGPEPLVRPIVLEVLGTILSACPSDDGCLRRGLRGSPTADQWIYLGKGESLVREPIS